MSSCSRLTEAPLVVGPVTQALKVEKALPEEVERLMQLTSSSSSCSYCCSSSSPGRSGLGCSLRH